MMDCTGKQRLTRKRAKDIARRMGRADKAVEPYECRTCGHWHVGGEYTERSRMKRIVKNARKTRKL